jgi:hypothetical protein
MRLDEFGPMHNLRLEMTMIDFKVRAGTRNSLTEIAHSKLEDANLFSVPPPTTCLPRKLRILGSCWRTLKLLCVDVEPSSQVSYR